MDSSEQKLKGKQNYKKLINRFPVTAYELSGCNTVIEILFFYFANYLIRFLQTM